MHRVQHLTSIRRLIGINIGNQQNTHTANSIAQQEIGTTDSAALFMSATQKGGPTKLALANVLYENSGADVGVLTDCPLQSVVLDSTLPLRELVREMLRLL